MLNEREEKMKIILLSDSHGAKMNIKKALDKHRDADAAIFLGDGLADFLDLCGEYPTTAFFAVRGNCDVGYSCICDARLSEEITLEGKKIFFCHGHAYSVKGGLGSILSAARARGADVLLFGHTHVPCERFFPEDEDGGAVLAVNPGSIGRGGEPSYAILTIRENGILVSHGKVW